MDDEKQQIIINRIAYESWEGIKSRDSDEELEALKIELMSCKEDIRRFARWIKIIEPPIPGKTGGGVIDFEILPHIDEFLHLLLTNSLLSVLKSRQVYISTTLAFYNLWMARSKIGSSLLLFSKGQDEARELKGKSQRMFDLLPPFMKLRLDPNSTEAMGFPTMNSVIKAFPSTVSAGISYTGSVVECDEHAFHEYADENYTSCKPTIDRGAQFISVSTAHPYSNDNLFTTIFTDALKNKNGFIPYFIPYTVVKGRDEEWYDRTKKSIPERDLAKLSPDLYMAKNYPRSIDEALAQTKETIVFDKKVLGVMANDVRGHLNVGWEGLDDRLVHVYKDFYLGNFYIVASDVAWGLQRDFSVTCIMDVKTGEIVADVCSQDLTPEQFAYQSVQLLRHFHSPLWWVEENPAGMGRTVIKVAKELGYTNFGYRDAKMEKCGLEMNEKVRTDLFGGLIPAINNYQIRIYSKEGLTQFEAMIRSNKDGKIEARSSGHDDYVMAVGICWLKKDDVRKTFDNQHIVSFQYQQRW